MKRLKVIDTGVSVRVAWIFSFVPLAPLACTGATDDSEGSGGMSNVASGGGKAAGGTSGTGGATSVDCASLSEAECKGESRCQQTTGYRVDEDNQCYEDAPVYFGCHAPGCPANIPVVEDPEGELWLFYNGCTPEGWDLRTDVPVSEACDDPAGGAGGQP